MFQIDTSSAAGSLPTPTTAGTAGYFTGGNVLSGVAATTVSADFLNGVQGELVSVLAKAGITANKTLFNQVITSLARLGGWNVSTLTATATLTVDQTGLLLVDCTAGNITLTLPAASALNAVSTTMLSYRIVRIDTSANTLTVAHSAIVGNTDTIEGATTITVAKGGRVTLTSDGASHWYQTATGAISGVALLNTANTGTLQVSGSLTVGGAINEAPLVFLTAAATTDIGSAASNFVQISGTTTITSLGAPINGARRVVWFAGGATPILTYNGSTLVLPGAASIATATGDVAIFEGWSGGWQCVSYMRNSGRALVVTPPVFTATFVSSPVGAIYTAGNQGTWAHGMGTVPQLVKAYLVSTSLNNGYSVGMMMEYPGHGVVYNAAIPGNTACGAAVTADGSNIYLRISTGISSLTMVSEADGSTFNPTSANWTTVVKAWN